MVPATPEDTLRLDSTVLAIETSDAAPEVAEQPLSRDEIDAFRTELQHLKLWLLEGLSQMEARTMSRVSRSASGDDQDWERSVAQSDMAGKRLLLAEVMAAFERIRENTYGQCTADHRLIPREVLEEIPWARYCTACAHRHIA